MATSPKDSDWWSQQQLALAELLRKSALEARRHQREAERLQREHWKLHADGRWQLIRYGEGVTAPW